jgi:hypothetical protein
MLERRPGGGGLDRGKRQHQLVPVAQALLLMDPLKVHMLLTWQLTTATAAWRQLQMAI